MQDQRQLAPVWDSIPADEVLKHRAFSCRLPTHYGDLRQVQLHMHPELGERILQLVDNRDELFHPHVARHVRAFQRSSSNERPVFSQNKYHKCKIVTSLTNVQHRTWPFTNQILAVTHAFPRFDMHTRTSARNLSQLSILILHQMI